jgi:hypothetical protein
VQVFQKIVPFFDLNRCLEMSDISQQIKSEFKQLPWMLGKLLGGILAVVGVAGLVLIWTGKSGFLLSSPLPYFSAELLGLLLFLCCSKAMAQGKKGSSPQGMPARTQLRMCIVVWSLLLLFAMAFLLVTYFATR